MKKLCMLSALLFASTIFAFAATPDITGKWTVHQSIVGNDSDTECNFAQTGTQLTGTCKGTDKDMPVKGQIVGNKPTWQFDSEYQGTPITVKFSGTIDDSGKMAGTVDVDPFGVGGDFTATPVKSATR